MSLITAVVELQKLVRLVFQHNQTATDIEAALGNTRPPEF